MKKYLKAFIYLLLNNASVFSLRNYKKGLNNTILAKNTSMDAIIGHSIVVCQNTIIDKESEINSYSFIGFNCSITKTKVGSFASVANNVSIGMGAHKLDNISTSSLFYKDVFKTLTEKECIIGNDVWIGVDAIILRGVKIGDGAVIGANSVVTKDIPDYAIAVGSPAKVIKYRFNDAQQKIIKESNWWQYSLTEAREIQEKVLNEISAFQ